MTAQKREPHEKRMTWFRGQFVPILYDTTGPYRGFGSKDWVPSSYLQRVVAFMFGTMSVIGGAGAMACTVLIKRDLIATLHSEGAASIFCFFLVCVALTGGVIVIALGIRLLKGVSARTSKASSCRRIAFTLIDPATTRNRVKMADGTSD